MPVVAKLRIVTLHSSTSPGFVWRAEVEAESEDMARFLFIQRWAGMIVSHDVRPSELEVEDA